MSRLDVGTLLLNKNALNLFLIGPVTSLIPGLVECSFVSNMAVTLTAVNRNPLYVSVKSKQALGLFCKVLAQAASADVLVFGTSSM
jgi:hypothetical protein